MESNLTPEFIQFVDSGQNVQTLIQKVIDRAQYLPGFLAELDALLDKFEDPFEEVPVEISEPENALDPEVGVMTASTGLKLEKRLKAAYCKSL